MIPWIVLVFRIVLAAVFAIAGAAKLADRRGFQAALDGFGAPQSLVPSLVWLVPASELAVAILLIPSATARAAATLASVLLIGFSVVVAVAIRRGTRPACGCFGSSQDTPIGAQTLIRNITLLAIAIGVVTAGAQQPELGEPSPAEVGVGLLGLAVAALAWFSWQLFRQQGRLLERIVALEDPGPGSTASPGLPIGAVAPELELPAASGGTGTLGELLADGKPVALVFSDPTCVACASLAPTLHVLAETRADDLTVAMLTRGDPEIAQRVPLEHVLVQTDYELVEAFGITVVPSAVIIDRTGVVASKTASGAPDVEALITTFQPTQLAGAR